MLTDRELELVEAVAVRVVQLLEQAARPEPWLDVAGVARLLAVEPEYVYSNASRLGARRLGSGPKARLRFRRDDVVSALPCLPPREAPSAADGVATRAAPRRRAAQAPAGVALLPIRGRTGGSRA